MTVRVQSRLVHMRKIGPNLVGASYLQGIRIVTFQFYIFVGGSRHMASFRGILNIQSLNELTPGELR